MVKPLGDVLHTSLELKDAPQRAVDRAFRGSKDTLREAILGRMQVILQCVRLKGKEGRRSRWKQMVLLNTDGKLFTTLRDRLS